MLKKLKRLAALSILSGTLGCASGSPAPVVSDYCRIARPILYDPALDSKETVKMIEDHNSRYVCVCENDCPTPVSP